MEKKANGWKKQVISATKSLWDMVSVAVIAAAIGIIITQVFIVIAFIPSGSMLPKFPVGSIVICLRTDYWNATPQRGEIVVFRRGDTDDKTYYTKRVVGLPGDTVTIQNGVTYINDERYDEPWLAETPNREDYGPFEIPEGEYFLMGDNRNNSYDCRFWEESYIPEETIYARARVVIDPNPFSIELIHYEKGANDAE